MQSQPDTRHINSELDLPSSECFVAATIPLVRIRCNPLQPRKVFEESELYGLVQSIQAVGLIHPPLVRSLDDQEDGYYELISGERRFQAAKLAGLTAIPVHIKKSSYQTSAEMALIENIQRVDLNPIEIAYALEKLIKTFKFSQETLARRIGKKRSSVANYLRLLTLPKNIQQSLLANAITMGHAKAILSLEDVDRQQLLYELVLRDELSVRGAEEAAVRLAAKARQKKLSYETRNFFLEQLAHKMSEAFGTKVHIQARGKKGRIAIDYYDYDDLDRLLERFGLKDNGSI